MVSVPGGALGPFRLAALAAVLSLFILLPVARAGAEQAGEHEYHEVARFGGLDESAFAGGSLTPGRFVEPTGFAVDPIDEEAKELHGEAKEAVYVADRTSGAEGAQCPGKPEGERCADWRIQKLSTTGRVLATTTFTLPVGSELPSHVRAATMIVGLAVDHAAGRLYALLMGPLSQTNAYYKHATAAQEIVAWSTTPAPCTGSCPGGGELTAATGEGVRSDPLGSTGGLVSGQAQLDAGKTPLYDPQGIVVDRLEKVGVENPVAIEASNLKGSKPEDAGSSLSQQTEKIEYREFEKNGDTIVQPVATQKGVGPKLEPLQTGGLRGEPWSGASVASELGASTGPLGIFDDPDGDISVLLRGTEASATNADLIRLAPELAKPEAKVLVGDKQEAQLPSEATMFLDNGPFFTDPAESTSSLELRNGPDETWGAGAEVAELSPSRPNGPELYAGDFYLAEPNCQGTTGYWHTEEIQRTCRPGSPFVQRPGANIGVRLLQPAASGIISDPQGRTIVNTIGNEHAESTARPEAHSPCEMGAQDAALADGAGGTLWVFDRGATVGKLAETERGGLFIVPRTEAAEGREIIELAPGEGSPSSRCPEPSGTFAMSLCGSGPTTSNALTVPVGSPVTFDASSVDLARGMPFAYRWEFGDGTEGQSATEPHAFATPGTHTVTLRVRGDFGEYATSATVQVEPAVGSQRLHAQFEVTSPPGARQAIFDASGSSPGICNGVYDYRWEWGDGSAPQDFQMPTVQHTFPASSEVRSYPVRLTVINTPGFESESTGQTVEVSPPTASLSEFLPELIPSSGPAQTPAAAPRGTGTQAPPAPDRGPTYVSPHARSSRDAVSVGISCPPAKVSCAGMVQTETATAFPSGAAGSGKKLKPRRTRLAIGSTPFSLLGGASRTLTVRLTARGASLLSRLRRLPVLVIVSARDPLGDPGVTVLHLTLSASRAATR